MTPNDDLSRWGEPPASEHEIEVARQLAELLEPGPVRSRSAGPAADLLEVDSWLEMLVTTVWSYSGLDENPPCPADAGGSTLVGATHPAAVTLRDLARVPEDADRVALRTGDRARVDVVCDRDGYLTVFNVGPHGTLNLLWPDDPDKVAIQPAGRALQVANVVLTPPAGRERVYAVWSRAPLSRQHLLGLGKPGVATRDMRRVQEAVDVLPPEDWRAVLLVLDHQG